MIRGAASERQQGGEPAEPPEPFGLAAEAARVVAERTGVEQHDVAVVLGSGWRAALDHLGATVAELAVTELPGFPAASVPGHGGRLRSLLAPGGARVLALAGRVHGYEGHEPAVAVHGVRTAHAAGCRTLVVTNAAGGIRPGLHVGQPVLIADHLNLTGRSPLTGPEPPTGVPSRFVDLTDAYTPRLRALARHVDPDLDLDEGVYAALPGPQYETPAEVRMLRTLGADLVGMSTVWEVVAARHLGLEVLGLSLVTNLAAGLGDTGLSHTEVLATGQAATGRLSTLLRGIVTNLPPG